MASGFLFCNFTLEIMLYYIPKLNIRVMKKTLQIFSSRSLILIFLFTVTSAINVHGQADFPYQQNFSEFVFNSGTEVTSFGNHNEWVFNATGDHATRLQYMGDWGSGTSTGFRGNDMVMGYQHSSASGVFSAMLTITNNTGETITLVNISYIGRVERISEGRSPEWTVEVDGQVVPELFYSTTGNTDQEKSAAVSVNVPAGEDLVIVWSSERGGPGGASKQIGIANLEVNTGEATQVAAPVFSPPGGLYFEEQQVSITTVTEGASIYYTLNGADPTENDILFDGPIEVTEDMNIKARAYKDGLDPSSVVSAEYTIRELVLWKDFEDEDLLSGGWMVYDFEPGANTWEIAAFSGITYAMITEYFSDPEFPHSWYISPELNFSGLEQITFSFYNQAAHRTGDAFSVHISPDYPGSGDPTQATWTQLDATLDSHTGGGFGTWTFSDEIDLSDYDGTVYIGFQYESDPDNIGRWHINDVLITAIEQGLSSNANLATFNLGGMNVLNLGGIVVNDPENDAGAMLYLDNVDDFQGIEVVTAHENASFTVTLNGSPLDETELGDQAINFNDVIIVTVLAENQSTIKHYKVTVLEDERVLTILTPQEGDEFFTYDEVVFSWEAENLDQLILQLFVQGFSSPFLTEIVNASDGQYIETVPNGLQFDFHYRLTDNNDPGFYVESGVFSYIDNVNPSLINKNPVAGSVDVPVDASLFLEFDEFLINLGEGSFHLFKQQNDELVESILADGSQVEYSFNEVYVSFSENLEFATTYYILIDDNAIKDMADNYYAGIDDPAYWTFTTKDDDTPPDGLICNGGFENWTDGLPDCWYGSKSNIPEANVVQYADNPHSGSYAVQLINSEGSHQRFTSQATQVESGVTYNIKFWVKGQGEIRTGLFDDRETGYGYAPYNQYVQVSSDSWSEHTQVVTAATNSGIAEFIFSIRNTGESMSHLQLDNVSVVVHTDEPDEVASIAELRNGQIGSIYSLSGEAVITYQQSYRNQKFIQDGTAAIMIDDNSGIMTTQYDQYDGITGLTGTLDVYNQMLQFVPVADPGAATSSGNIVNPEIVTLDALGPAHQAMLVQVWNVTFEDSGNFATGQNYTLNSPNGTGVFRTAFFDADYIDTAIPSQPQIITAIVQQFMETMQVTARSLEDFELHTSISENDMDGIKVYPNPFSDQIHITNHENISSIRLQNSMGQLIMEVMPSPGIVSIPASQLKPGIYFIRIHLNDGNSLINKLIKH